MLSTQFFNRVQLAKLLDFKSDSSIKELEKKGFIKPDIKPSKYSLTQVFFLFFCNKFIINIQSWNRACYCNISNW